MRLYGNKCVVFSFHMYWMENNNLAHPHTSLPNQYGHNTAAGQSDSNQIALHSYGSVSMD